MMRVRGMAWTLFAIAGMAVAVSAQESGASPKPPEEKPYHFALGLRMESWSAPLDFHSPSGGGGGGQPLDFSIGTVAGFLTSNLEYRVLHDLVASAHVGLGVEGLRFSMGLINFAFNFDESPSFVFDGGLAGRYEINPTWDVGLDLSFRWGRGEYNGLDPGTGMDTTITWKYWWLRSTFTVGGRISEAIRLYAGLRGTYQDGGISKPSDLGDVSGIRFRRPFGIIVGMDVAVKPVVASLEVEFVDVDLGLMASFGVKF